ncbi:hypothetical protein GKE82_24310 [Conexibacter sp. W3-3-2]|uniref:hypothetical protein n=1 Tax=Conexibacter sp. W3-3-2 TaxID=2675227 RepID=UPI0012BA352C|nr:hypothetical protein [Conexibacter sp. W3-3-2]MTD47333.1 hypothetical protein [Conexibacter sp. W3-3-2]
MLRGLNLLTTRYREYMQHLRGARPPPRPQLRHERFIRPSVPASAFGRTQLRAVNLALGLFDDKAVQSVCGPPAAVRLMRTRRMSRARGRAGTRRTSTVSVMMHRISTCNRGRLFVRSPWGRRGIVVALVGSAFSAGHLAAEGPSPAQSKTSAKGPKASISLAAAQGGKVFLRADGRQRAKDPSRFDGVLGVRALPTTGRYTLVVQVAAAAGRPAGKLRYDVMLTGP